jgi:hypothetical protein
MNACPVSPLVNSAEQQPELLEPVASARLTALPECSPITGDHPITCTFVRPSVHSSGGQPKPTALVSRTPRDCAQVDDRAGDRATDSKDNTVLMVTADETRRQRVGWILAAMNMSARLVPSWRAALVSTICVPSCPIADLDDAGDNTASAAVRRKSWGGSVPLIVLSQQPEWADRATRVGAVAGHRKPLDVGALMGTVQHVLPSPNFLRASHDRDDDRREAEP